MDNMKDSINATRKGFEESFASGEFYNKQTQDEKHLSDILEFLPIKDGMKILDLGTGSGYLAFPIAKGNPKVIVVGLDIVEKTLKSNEKKSKEYGINNISFVPYDGINFPFENDEFDMVISRYALHHFPDINWSMGEIARVLKKNGKLFISDPAPDNADKTGFVDDFMRMKPDGHIKFYSKEEWINICGKSGFKYDDNFESRIRFPRKREESVEFDNLVKKHGEAVLQGYDIEVTGEEIYITEGVNNMLFTKGIF